MHEGVWALAWCAWKRRIHINLHGKQGNKVACNIELEDINFCLGTCNMGLWPCIQKWSPIKFLRSNFTDKILEVSLVFPHGITPAWVNHNRCFVKNASWCSVQCTGILLVHENNTWQNSTANEGFESIGRGYLDLARGSQNIGDPFVHRCLCHRWMRNGSSAHASSSAHVGDKLARAVLFLSHQAAGASRRSTGDPHITPSNRSRTHSNRNSTNWTKFMQARRYFA